MNFVTVAIFVLTLSCNFVNVYTIAYRVQVYTLASLVYVTDRRLRWFYPCSDGQFTAVHKQLDFIRFADAERLNSVLGRIGRKRHLAMVDSV